jgi:hypothetical protein
VPHLVARQFFLRANRALMLGFITAGLGVCVIAAIAHDVGRWLSW